MHFAEMGVVLLLFLVGLELEPLRLWALAPLGLRLGQGAGLLCAACGDRRHRVLRHAWPAAIVMAFGLAMSSTRHRAACLASAAS